MAEFEDVCRYCGHEVERYESDVNMWRHRDQLAASFRGAPCSGQNLIADIDPSMSDTLTFPAGTLAKLNARAGRYETSSVKSIRKLVDAPLRVVVLVLRMCDGKTAEAAAWLIEHGYERKEASTSAAQREQGTGRERHAK